MVLLRSLNDRRFWIVDCPNKNHSAKVAADLYKEVLPVPYMAKYVVFGKRNDLITGRLRIYCLTGYTVDKILELKENFVEVARSRDVEVIKKTYNIGFCRNMSIALLTSA